MAVLLWLAEKWDNPVFLWEMRRRRLRRWLTAAGIASLAIVIAGPILSQELLSPGVWFVLLPSWPIVFAALPSAATTFAITLGARGRQHEELPLSSLRIARGLLAAGSVPFVPGAVVGVGLVALLGFAITGLPKETAGFALYSLVWCAALMLAPALMGENIARGEGMYASPRWRIAGPIMAMAGILVWWAMPTVLLVQMARLFSIVRPPGAADLPSDIWPFLLWVGQVPAAVVIVEVGWLAGAGRWIADRAKGVVRRWQKR